MSVECNGPFLKCGDMGTYKYESSSSSSSGFDHSHHFLSTVKLVDPGAHPAGLVVNPYDVTRTYSASWSSSSSTSVSSAAYVYPSGAFAVCSTPGPSSHTCRVSENCSIKRQTLLFLSDSVALIKHEEQVLRFEVGSSETVQFKGKWGNSTHHKVKIKDTVRVRAREWFALHVFRTEHLLEGEPAVFSQVTPDVEYAFMPFTGDDIAVGTWGLYGNLVTQGYSGWEPGVAMILVYPQPASLGIPLGDADIDHYGFYDYNAKEGGFTESALVRKDGGKDMFYPEWCRNMLPVQPWREHADARYEIRWDPNRNKSVVPPVHRQWSPPAPLTDSGSFGHAVDFRGSRTTGGRVEIVEYGSAVSFVVVDHYKRPHVFNLVRPPGSVGWTALAPADRYPSGAITTYGLMSYAL